MARTLVVDWAACFVKRQPWLQSMGIIAYSIHQSRRRTSWVQRRVWQPLVQSQSLKFSLLIIYGPALISLLRSYPKAVTCQKGSFRFNRSYAFPLALMGEVAPTIQEVLNQHCSQFAESKLCILPTRLT